MVIGEHFKLQNLNYKHKMNFEIESNKSPSNFIAEEIQFQFFEIKIKFFHHQRFNEIMIILFLN